MKSQSTIECLILRVNHAALEIVSAEELGLSFADHGRRFRSQLFTKPGLRFCGIAEET